MLGDCLKEFTKNQQQDVGVTVKYSLSCLQKKSLLKIFYCLHRLLLNISEVWKKTKLSHLKLCKCFLVLLFSLMKAPL